MSRRDDPTPALWREDYGGVLRPVGEPVPAPDPPARHDAPETSKAAARSARRTAPTLRERVRAYSVAAGPTGATCEATTIALGERTQSVSARINDLVRAGAIRPSGRTRRTTSGCKARVYVAAGEGVGDG